MPQRFESWKSRLLRLLLLLATLAAGALSAWHAALGWSRSLPPDAVPSILAAAPWQRLAGSATLWTDPNAKGAPAGTARGIAQEVLRESPLNALALRHMAMADMLKRPDRANHTLALAERISRRDLATELLEIEASAQQGRVAETLRHYDHALTVFPEARKQLFPILARALDDADIVRGLGVYADREWLRSLAGQALALGADSKGLVDLVVSVHARLETEAREKLVSQLLGPLATGGHHADARRLVTQLDGFDVGTLENLGFSSATTDPRIAPFNWSFPEHEAAEVALADSSGLTALAPPEKIVVLAERITILAPGVYALQQTLDHGGSPSPGQLRWDVACLGGAKETIWRQLMPLHTGHVAYRASLAIPAGCAAQRWRITVTGGGSVSELRLSDVSLQAQ